MDAFPTDNAAVFVCDVLRVVCVVGGLAMVGLVIRLFYYTMTVPPRLKKASRYASVVFFVFAAVAIQRSIERLGQSPTWQLFVNLFAVGCGLMFVRASHRLLTPDKDPLP